MILFHEYQAATRVLNHSCTTKDVEIANKAGLVEWSVDCDTIGYYPSPTQAYVDYMDSLEGKKYYLKVVNVHLQEKIFTDYYSEMDSLLASLKIQLKENDGEEVNFTIETIL